MLEGCNLSHKFRRNTIKLLRIIFSLLVLYLAQCAEASATTYLSCTGYSGTSPMQDQIPLESREITLNKSPVSGSIAVDDTKISVAGIPFMDSTYGICEDSDQSLFFAAGCSENNPHQLSQMDPETRKSVMRIINSDCGVINKVTGTVRYHAGDLLFILTCHKAEKVLK